MSQPNIRLPPKWIEMNIMKRECSNFIPSPGDETLCQCGRRKMDHEDFVKHQHRPDTWSPSIHTRPFNTDAYGTILFEGEHHPNKAHYVRLSYDTNPETIVQLMTYVWNLDMPQLVISVRGGSTDFEMSPRLGKIFHAGIIKAARSTNAWVFSNGLNSGAAKHLGVALAHDKWRGGPRKGRVVSVGMAPWGMIENRNDLLGRNKDRTYSPLDHASSKFLQLNSRHSNFLLVDNGSIGKFGGENYMRRRLERCITTYPTSPNRGCDTPVVVIIVEGGFYTLRQVSDYLYDDPPIPVVIFAGTGRCADLIAWIMRRVQSEEEFDRMKGKIYQKIMQAFQLTNDSQCSVLCHELRNIYLMKNLITVYDPHSTAQEEEFDAVILSSIFRSQHWTPLQQLSLTLVWNRVDIAQAEVFIYGREWVRDHLEHAMMDALVANRTDFVTLLLEHGLNMQTFLTASRLEALYSLERMPSRLLQSLIVELSKLHVKRQKQIDISNRHSGGTGNSYRNLTLHDVGIALSHMIGHVYKSNYIHVVAKINKTQGGTAEEHEVRAQTFLQPFDDLFVWAVLTKRHEMAKLLWIHGKGALAKSLVAVKLNRYMAIELNAQERTYANLAIDFESYAAEWETLSVSLLDSCYHINSKMARLLLTMELESWSKQTCLTLAVMANHRTLLGHPCCQQLLADLWMGALSIRSYSTFKIVFGVLFPPCAFLLEYKSTEELRLLPHQGKSGHSFDQVLDGGQTEDATLVGSRYTAGHHYPKYSHNGKRLDMVRSASSLMTLLQRKGRSRSDYNQHHQYPTSHRQNERKTDLAEVVKNIFPAREEDTASAGSILTSPPEPPEMTRNHQQNRHLYHQHHLHVLHHPFPSSPEPPRTAGVHFNEEGISNPDDENSSKRKQKHHGHSFITTQYPLGTWDKFIEFQCAPVTNFYRHTIAYLLFLIALAYVILYPQHEKNPGYTEMYVIAYFATQFLECIREFILIDALSFSEKLAEVQQNVWQFGDLLVVTGCLFCGVALRFTHEYFEHGMLVYRLSSIYWNGRLLKYLGVHRFLGPKIVMMSRMLRHMVHFAMIIVVVIISFGVARQAIKSPDAAPTIKDLADSFLEPYQMVFGEVDMNVFSLQCTDEDHDGHGDCHPGHWVIPLAWVVYMMVANILIVDILIAVYNGIYEEVDSIAVEVWMFQRFNFVMEFEQKPVLPPPFIIICHAFSFIKFIYDTFFSCLCEEELLLEAQLDDDIRPHIIMGNDHSLKSYLSQGEQSMVFDFEEENVENLTPLLDKDTTVSTGFVSSGGGNVIVSAGSNHGLIATNTVMTAEHVATAAAAFRMGMGNDKFAMQQIKIVIGELHTELEGQKNKVDKLISCLERERELQDEDQEADDDYEEGMEQRPITTPKTNSIAIPLSHANDGPTNTTSSNDVIPRNQNK